MILSVTISQDRKDLPTFALIDSGAEGTAFIDQAWASKHGLVVKEIPHPITLYGFNGDPLNTIGFYATLAMRASDHTESRLHFYICPLGTHPVILGMPWLKLHDPAIRFSSNSLRFDSDFCHQYCNAPLRPTRV